MHYCQACDEPRLMRPDGAVARCPTCGHVDAAAARAPLLVVTGASGSGKTSILPELLPRLRGQCVVFDVDWLIDPFAHQPDRAEVHWPALRDAWLHVAHGVAQNGLPTLLLGPLIPAHVEELRGRPWVGDVHFLLLDCPDAERRRRLEARPAWRTRDAAAQLDFARWLRANVQAVVDTGGGAGPAESAGAVAAWARGVLGSV